MIYPSARAVFLTSAGAPVALLLGVLAPKFWIFGPVWVVFSIALVLVDAALGGDRRGVELSLTAPLALGAGRGADILVQAVFGAGAVPHLAQFAVDVNARLEVEPARRTAAVDGRIAVAAFAVTPVRRGRGEITRVWARWRGPLGLVWKQRAEVLDRELLVTLDIGAIKDEALRLFSRNAFHGARIQQELGEGSEFHALSEFRAGMDRRTIDWKQSARHGTLLAKEFRAERNHPIVLAVDSGRLMCEPVGGVPRIDYALNAALMLAYVGLRAGDRAGLFSFDARPNLWSGALSGPNAFSHLQRLAAAVDYSAQETNFTLGLTQLAGELGRRSLVVIFTDFADTTSAELMLENVARLLKQHLVVFVIMRDDELEDMTRKAPEDADDVSRAVVAAALLRERDLVVARLKRLGVEIVEGPADGVGPVLLARYLDLKRRDRL